HLLAHGRRRRHRRHRARDPDGEPGAALALAGRHPRPQRRDRREAPKAGGGAPPPHTPTPTPPAGPFSPLTSVRAPLGLDGASLPSHDSSARGRSPLPTPLFQPAPVASMPHAASAAARGPGPEEVSLRSVSQTVRVDIRKLDRLMTIVGELAIVKTAMARLSERARSRATGPKELAIELGRLNRTLDRHLAQMQSGILEVRMVPLGQAFDKLARVV